MFELHPCVWLVFSIIPMLGATLCALVTAGGVDAVKGEPSDLLDADVEVIAGLERALPGVAVLCLFHLSSLKMLLNVMFGGFCGFATQH